MDFSEAFNQVRNGQAIYRRSWNGNRLNAPTTATEEKNFTPSLFVMCQWPDEHSKMGNPYLYINAKALGGERNPWVPSQTDLFATDWETCEVSE